MKRIAWTEQAKADVRTLDRQTAMRILSALHRFVDSGTGDVKALQGDVEELRLRIGDYRLSSSRLATMPSRSVASATGAKPIVDGLEVLGATSA